MSNTRTILLASLLGVTVALAAYGVRVAYLKKQVIIQGPEGKSTMYLGRVPAAKLINAVTGETTTLEPISPGSHRLLVFLSAADCSSCLRILSEIHTLPSRVSGARLTTDTVFVRSSADEVRDYLRDVDTRGNIRTYLDSFRDIELGVGLPQRTPVAVLVDAGFNVELAEPATTSEDDQKRFVDLVVQLTAKEK
jgi:hypothetical protein